MKSSLFGCLIPKYRIKTEKNRLDDSNEDIESKDYVPDDAINQMHRYRDALIRLSEPRFSEPRLPESPSGKIEGQPAKKAAQFLVPLLYTQAFLIKPQHPTPTQPR